MACLGILLLFMFDIDLDTILIAVMPALGTFKAKKGQFLLHYHTP